MQHDLHRYTNTTTPLQSMSVNVAGGSVIHGVAATVICGYGLTCESYIKMKDEWMAREEGEKENDNAIVSPQKKI